MNYSKLIFILIFSYLTVGNNILSRGSNAFYITQSSPKVIDQSFFKDAQPKNGDTIFILSERTNGIRFSKLNGAANNPIVIINKGGIVEINDESSWGALTFENCTHIKVTGTGFALNKYGFKLSAQTCGLAFTEYSSDCEAEFIEINHDGFFGIYAKKDFSGNPPTPYPVFNNLSIHDTFISNVTEGMYLGETKSPGMEFKHVRVYNNLIKNTGREGIQVANMVEDVEVFNNTIINSGLDHEMYQGNNFQIGDNTVGKYYNNVFINAPAHGMIIMGSGNIEVFNNYFESNTGIFIDNRLFTKPLAPIDINNNLFLKTIGTEVILNLNEINPISITNNKYDGTATFIPASNLKQANLKVSNNLNTSPVKVVFQDTINYETTPANPGYNNSDSRNIEFNAWPSLESIKDAFVFSGSNSVIQLKATVADNDLMTFSIDSLPDFISLIDSINGFSKLVIKPTPSDIGTYQLIVSVTDHSHQASDRTKVKIIVALKTNHLPIINLNNEIEVTNLTETILPVKFSDADSDKINLKLIGSPEFAIIEAVNDSLFHLILKPKYLDSGNYAFQLSYSDSHCSDIIYPINLKVNSASFSYGTPVYRLNCGGPELVDKNLNWESVYNNGSGKRYVSTLSYETGSHFYKGVNNTSAPDYIFGPYSFDYPGGAELKWKFPIRNGKYRVNLFFKERQADIDFDGSKAIFDVLIENNTVLSNFSIFSESGDNPLQKSFEVTVNDQALNIDFKQKAGKPKISGIEIIYLEAGNMPPVITGLNNMTIQESDTLIVPLQITDELPVISSGITVSGKNFPKFAAIRNNLEKNTRELVITPDYTVSGEYDNLKIFVSDGEFIDSTTFNLTVTDKLRPEYPVFHLLKSIVMNEGEKKTLQNIVTDPENNPMSLTISPLEFVKLNNQNGQWNLEINPDYYSSGKYMLMIKSTDNNGHTSADSINILVNDYNPQIILNNSMFTDEVKGGSVDSPNYLADEQNLNPENSGVPVSKSWKPSYTSTNGPFSTTIDLGAVYDIVTIALHDMNNIGPIIISEGKPGSWTELYTETTDYYNAWKIRQIKSSTRYLRITLNAGSAAYINELVLYGTLKKENATQVGPIHAENTTESKDSVNAELTHEQEKLLEKRIILNPQMVIDEVKGGSTDSPVFLVDEQSLSIENNEHPTGKSWKPFYNATKAPYNVTIDLGAKYKLSQVCFHDMNNTGPMTISYGEPGNWTTLYIENFNTYLNWKKKEISVKTRYLRLTLEAGSAAYCNEMGLYGYCLEANPETNLKNAAINTVTKELDDFPVEKEPKVFPTVFSQTISLQIPNAHNTEFIVSFCNSSGQQIFNDQIYFDDQMTKTYSENLIGLNKGMYIMRITDKGNGETRTFKLFKSI